MFMHGRALTDAEGIFKSLWSNRDRELKVLDNIARDKKLGMFGEDTRGFGIYDTWRKAHPKPDVKPPRGPMHKSTKILLGSAGGLGLGAAGTGYMGDRVNAGVYKRLNRVPTLPQVPWSGWL